MPTLTANGLSIHYARTGGDKPPLVLAHGFSDSGACWASLVGVLAADYDVVCYDARGHGESEVPSGGYSGEEQADDLLGLIDALELDRPILMGHSMGGDTVAWAAVKQPGRLRAAVLEDSGIPWGAMGAEQREGMRKGMLSWIRGLKTQSLDELIQLVASNDPGWPSEDRRPWAESKLQLSEAAIEGFASAERRDVTAHYPDVDLPILLLKADAASDERARHSDIVKRLPRGTIVHVEGAGHNVRRDQPARTCYHLGRFLSGLR